jgi:hypothetical protein
VGQLQDPIGQRRLAVIDVGDDREVADMGLVGDLPRLVGKRESSPARRRAVRVTGEAGAGKREGTAATPEVGGFWAKLAEKGFQTSPQYWFADDERVVVLIQTSMDGRK